MIFDQVPQLLIDTYTAYQKGDKEYFLQFITIKQDNTNPWYELIDGQQRLTTLTLLLYCMAQTNSFSNIANNKLIYSRYQNGNIFDYIFNTYLPQHSKQDDQYIKEQDTYYMVRALRCMQSFFDNMGTCDLCNYRDYLLNNVKLIVNEQSPNIPSQTTFINLNSNKVSLTNTYLIKGLLLTFAVQRQQGTINYTYQQILDQRQILGRQWDEISTWFSQQEVSHYLFQTDQDPMEKVLQLALDITTFESQIISNNVIQQLANSLSTTQVQNKDLDLFNTYNEKIQGNSNVAIELLGQIKHIYRFLRSIYDNRKDNTIYNLLGYVMFCYKNKSYEVLKAIVTINQNDANKLTQNTDFSWHLNSNEANKIFVDKLYFGQANQIIIDNIVNLLNTIAPIL